MFYLPLSFSFFIFLLLYNFIIFLPQFFLFLYIFIFLFLVNEIPAQKSRSKTSLVYYSWELRKRQNLSSVYFPLAKFQLVSCNLPLTMIWQMTYTHKLPKLCSATLTLWRPLIDRFRSIRNDAHFPFWIHLTFSLTIREKDRNSPWHVYLRKTKMQLNCIQLAGNEFQISFLATFMLIGWKTAQQGGFH